MVTVPVMKLFSLTVKTLAKPMAKRIKSGEERKDDGFRNATARDTMCHYVRKCTEYGDTAIHIKMIITLTDVMLVFAGIFLSVSGPQLL